MTEHTTATKVSLSMRSRVSGEGCSTEGSVTLEILKDYRARLNQDAEKPTLCPACAMSIQERAALTRSDNQIL